MYPSLFTVTYWGIPFLRGHQTFHRLHSPFNLVVHPCELHTGSDPHSLASSDLSQTSLSLDLIIDPHELSYWGISPPSESVCIIILVFYGFGPLDQIIVYFSLSRDRTYINQSFFLSVWVWVFQDRTYIDRSFSVSVYVFGTAPISIGHHLVYFTSACVFEAAPISIDHFPIGFYLAWVGTAPILIGHHLVSLGLCFWDHTYIDWSSSLSISVWVFGVAPISIDYLPIIVIFSLSRDYTYIDRSSSCQFEFMFLGPHLYRPVIILLVLSIGHSSCQFSLSQGHTYIDRSSSYQLISTFRVFI